MASEATDQTIELIRGLGAGAGIVQKAYADDRIDFSDAKLLFQSQEEAAEVVKGFDGASEVLEELKDIVADRNFDAALEIVTALAEELEGQGVDVPYFGE